MIQKIKDIFSSDSTKSKIARNVFWSVAGKVISMASALFVGILVARYLGPSQYGAMNYAISIVALFGILASFGMSGIVIRELSKYPEKREIILGTSFVMRILLAVITICFIGIYLFLSNESTSSIVLILIYSTTLLFSSFDVIRGYFTSIIQNEYIVKSEIFRTIVAAILQIILLLLKAPLYAFIVVLAFNIALLSSGYIIAYTKKVGSILSWKFDRQIAINILKASFPLLLAAATSIVYQRIDQVMIAKMLNDTSLGYFATAMSFAGVLAFIPDMAMQTLVPLLVKYYKDDRKLYEQRSQMILGIIIWVMIFFSCIISFLSYPIIYYTYGIEYIVSVPVLQILAFKLIGVAVTVIGDNLIVIENIHQYAVVRGVLACTICILLNIYLIPRWGIIGSAWATIITVVFQGWIANLFIPKYHHIFKKQAVAVLSGWKYIINYKTILK